MHDVSAIGPINIDLLITGAGPDNWDALTRWDGPADMEMTAAGSVGYTVSNLAWLGLSVQVFSAVPDDALGLFLRHALQEKGVETHLMRSEAGTLGGIGVYMLLFGSRKRPLSYRLPTHELWPTVITPEERESLLNARLLHCGGYLHHQSAWHGATRDLFQEAKKRALITSMDPQFPLYAMTPPWGEALWDVLPFVDILFCDEHEARQITGLESLDDAGARLLDAGCPMVVIKQNAEGSTTYTAAGIHHQPAAVLGPLVDSIGAGDTFDAGFLYGKLQGWSLEQCALFATVAAGYSVLGVGGSQSLPSLETILAEMQRRL